MLFLRHEFGKEEIYSQCNVNLCNLFPCFRREIAALLRKMRGERKKLASRTQFQAFKSGGDVQANLALQAQRL
jgi:hypothetical protein